MKKAQLVKKTKTAAAMLDADVMPAVKLALRGAKLPRAVAVVQAVIAGAQMFHLLQQTMVFGLLADESNMPLVEGFRA